MSPARKPQLPDAGAVVAALEGAWDVIRAHHPEVPPVVLVFGSCSARRAARRKLGHFAPARWLPVHDGEPFKPQALPEAIDDGDLMAQLAASAGRLLRSAELLSWEAAASLSEVLITADGLAGSASEVMGTLVHEAAHAIAFQRGIKDTSRQGRYHNQRFKAIAEEIGLDVRRDPGWGWSVTTLSDLPPLRTATRAASSQVRCAPPVSTSCIQLHLLPDQGASASLWCASVVSGSGSAAPCLPSAAPSAAYVAMSWRSRPDGAEPAGFFTIAASRGRGGSAAT